MKKFFKRAFITLIIIVGLLIAVGLYLHESLPEGSHHKKAEVLTDKIQKAIHQEAWDSTRFVSWNFAGIRSYVWDKKRNLVKTELSDATVVFNTQTLQGVVLDQKSVKLFGEQAQEKIEQAWNNFANDSFWMIAPYKLRDPGTERSLVIMEQDTCLMVTYTSGGVTPGDSYVWLLDKDYTPKAWKLWVKIIPIGGMKYGWDQWETTKTGARIATLHKGLFNIEIKDLKTGMRIEDVTNDEDPFEAVAL